MVSGAARIIMTPDTLSQRTIVFVNIAHAFDHFVLLIYPTAVIVIASEWGLEYSTLIALATGAFVAFGVCSLPMGWLADRYGRRNMMLVFFIGYGASCLGLASAGTANQIFWWLLVLGIMSAIYHPVGSAMLVTHARSLGKTLGWNGAIGNLGAAVAAGVTAAIATTLGWRMAFILPGSLCIGVGLIFWLLVPHDGQHNDRDKGNNAAIKVHRPGVVLGLFAVAIIAGGMTFNMTTIALPKIIDERAGLALTLQMTGLIATGLFLMGAVTQILIGRLVDRFDLPAIFVGLSVFQPLGLLLAATTQGVFLLIGLVAAMASIYGQVVVNDAIVAKYVSPQFRVKAFSIRYFLGFTVSGFAVPIIAILHTWGEFPAVLAVTAAFGLFVFAAALMFMHQLRPARFQSAVR